MKMVEVYVFLTLCFVCLQLVYHALQLVLFACLAILIMRLKLFLTPHMCIMASLICSKRVSDYLSYSSYIVIEITVFTEGLAKHLVFQMLITCLTSLP